MREIITRNSDRIAVAVVAVALVLAVTFGVAPMYRTVRDAHAALERDRIAIDVRTDRIVKGHRATADRDAVLAASSRIVRLPSDADIVHLVEDLERAAEQREVSVTFTATADTGQAQKKGKEKDKDANVRRLSVAVTGPFPKVMSFLVAVENHSTVVSVETVALAPTGSTPAAMSDALPAAPGAAPARPAVVPDTVDATIRIAVPVRPTDD